MENVKLKNGFKQVCVWPGTIVGKDKISLFEDFMKENFGVRIQYLEEIETNPDIESEKPVEGTGGRVDVFFAIHNDDIGRFAIKRLAFGIRWIEDVLASCNHSKHLYPKRVEGYKCWDADG